MGGSPVRGQRPISTAIVMYIVLMVGASKGAWATGGARLIEAINLKVSPESGSFPQEYHRLGSVTYFRATTPANGMELWRTDGTTAGTWLLKDIWPGVQGSLRGSPAVNMIGLGSVALFVANDGV